MFWDINRFILCKDKCEKALKYINTVQREGNINYVTFKRTTVALLHVSACTVITRYTITRCNCTLNISSKNYYILYRSVKDFIENKARKMYPYNTKCANIKL